MKITQQQTVINQLRSQGFITRNWCLQNYISRLGAIVCDLNQSGWNIQGDWIKTDHGRDYKYSLITSPTKTITRVDFDSLPPLWNEAERRWKGQARTVTETAPQ